ncbi:MAG: signal peptide peptidase SppA, partial [Bacteroidota bacterium]
MPDSQPNQPMQPNFPPPYPPYYRKKTRWWIPVAIIGGIILVFIIMISLFIGSISSSFSKESYEVQKNSVLYLDLGKTLVEYEPDNPLNILGASSKATFFDVITAIKRAKTDDRIQGIYYKSSLVAIGFAKAKEIQDALVDFKKSGKFLYAYIETGREIDYYLALPADKIFMPSEAMMELNGFGASSVFLKGFFEKIGIDFYVLGFEDFKSAGESLSRKNFSDSSRKQIRVLLEQRYDMLINAIAKFRKLAPEKVNKDINEGMYSADVFLARGYVDTIITESDLKDKIKKEIFGTGKKAEEKKLHFASIGNYLSAPYKKKEITADKNKQIAIIFGVGAIIDQEGNSPFGGESNITPKKFIKYLKEAREDDDVKVIIIRIDSPGGSVIASDAIYEEILKTKKVKPVYASMSDVAASGGYYIPIACDTIIAHPATITGSIGVILAIPNINGLLGKLGITADTVSIGKNSQFLNGMYPYTDNDKAKLYSIAKPIYDRFLNKVAKNRHKTYDQVRAIAKGRVWSGADAYKLGLVDVLGGMETALSIAKKRIGVPDSMKVFVQIYPEKEDPMVVLLKAFGLEKDDEESMGESLKLTTTIAKIFGFDKQDFMTAYNTLPANWRGHLNYYLNLLYMSNNGEKALMAMPY